MLSKAINNKDSVDTGAKHWTYWTYSVKLHSEKYSTWYMKYEKHNISCWCQNKLRDGARPDSHVAALWSVHIVKNDIYLPYRFQTLISLIKSTWRAFKIFGEELREIFFKDNFDLVLLKKITYFLSFWSFVHISVLKLYDLNIF